MKNIHLYLLLFTSLLLSCSKNPETLIPHLSGYLEIDEVEENYETLDKQVGFIPFNSRNKWMARVFKPNREKIAQSGDCFNFSDDECVVTMKGYILILFITLKVFKS